MERFLNNIIRKTKKLFNKKYFLVVSIFTVLIVILGFTYGYMSYESGWQLASSLKISNLYYQMTIDGNAANSLSVSANSGTTYHDIVVTSLNDINTRYALTYSSTVNGVTVKISTSSVNKQEGVIGLYTTGTNAEKTKTIRVAVTNDTNSAATVTFNVAGGYTWNPENDITMLSGYSRITDIKNEVTLGFGLTLAEEIDQILNCTPTSTSPCLYKENANNYLTYSGHTWRIVGTYLIGSEEVVKLVLDQNLTTKSTYANVNSALTTFYNGLSDKTLIRTASPFTCTGTSTISCSGSANIGSISKSEYDLIGGVNSYLYTKPEEDYWTSTSYYVGTSRGISNKTSSYQAYVRPSIYLKSSVIKGDVSISTVTMTNLISNPSFENAFTNWSGYPSEYTISTTETKFGTRSLRNYHAAQYTGAYQEVSPVAGHTYYISTWMKTKTVASGKTCSLAGGIIHDGISEYDWPIYMSQINTNVWEKLGNTYTFPSGTTGGTLTIKPLQYNGTDKTEECFVDGIMLVDLTSAFGAGNEPSSDWCDNNIDYFEGSKTITQRTDEVGTVLNPYTVIQGVKLTVTGMTNATADFNTGYYEAGKSYTLTNAISSESSRSFSAWSLVSGIGASLTGSTLVMGTAETTITALWKDEYFYTGSYQTFTAYGDGYYKVEAWGAQGGSAKYSTEYAGGKGSYTSGYIYLNSGDKLYVYPGGMGISVSGTTGSATVTYNGSGYNGGGRAGFNAGYGVSGGGGGASDVRYFGSTTPTAANLEWNSDLGLNSRIMVAAGGGGARSHKNAPKYSGVGGAGGALYGELGKTASSTCYWTGVGGTQASAGNGVACYDQGQSGSASYSIFGRGDTSMSIAAYTTTSPDRDYSGGGGGYYGGGIGYHASGGGGSSFISGYAGSNAITSSSSRTHIDDPLHYSGKYFVGGIMKANDNTGNGKVEITYVRTLERKDNKLNNVRYIKDCTTGNQNDDNKDWVEIQAIKNGTNIAKNKTVTGTATAVSGYGYSYVTDGNISQPLSTDAQFGRASTTGEQCVTVDLGTTYDLDEVAVWHRYALGVVYNSNKTYVSSNNSSWTEVIDKQQSEIADGKRTNAYTEDATYPTGYSTLTYIQTSGFQSINPLPWASIKPTTRILIDFQFLNTTVQQRVFSVKSGDLKYEVFINGSTYWAFSYQNSSSNSVSTGKTVNTSRHTVDFDGKNKVFKVDNGSVLSVSLSSYTATNTSTSGFYVGANTDVLPAQKASFARIYSLKIYDNGTLIRDMVPMLRLADNKAGLYDTVNDVFYTTGAYAEILTGPPELMYE